MEKRKHAIKLTSFALLAGVFALLPGCAGDLAKDARFGAFGGKAPEATTEASFDINSTMFETRWFPAHVRWAPDDSHLLVSLCHVNRTDYCRMGKYWIDEARWELLELQPQVTYRWPSYAPDGKSIVVTAGGCDQNYRCPHRLHALLLLRPDGRHAVKLVDSYARQPTFSDDGTKIIYWRYTGGGGADVAMFDLEKGNEEMLTQLVFYASSTKGGAYFLPGAQRFVFAGWLPTLFGNTRREIDGKPVDGYQVDDDGTFSAVHPFSGTKLELQGENYGTIRYVADRRNGVVTRKNIKQVDLLWPDHGASANNAGPEDVSRTGEVLYYCPNPDCYSRKAKTAELAIEGIDRARSPSPGQQILMLRPAREDAPDSAAFIFDASAQVTALSNDASRVAFSEANPGLWHFTRRLGIAARGDSVPRFIEWPRLNLDAASTQRVIIK